MFPTAVIFFKIGSGLFDVFINDKLSLYGFASYCMKRVCEALITVAHLNANPILSVALFLFQQVDSSYSYHFLVL